MTGRDPSAPLRLRRDLGTLESYAALIGMLIGGGIYRVIKDASDLTGPGVIVGYLVLAPVVLATAVPYAVFVSTPMGVAPGGEYTHLARVMRSPLLAFLAAWLKIISYVGALAYLADALAGYVVKLVGGASDPAIELPLALGSLVGFGVLHGLGVRWFGRLQVAMCLALGLSIAVLVVPGLFAVELKNLTPVFPLGLRGFTACLPLLFFAYAGFEALAQTAGEVKDSTRRLPRVFLIGIATTTAVYLLLSVVTVGVLSPAEMAASDAPVADAAAVFLWGGLSWFVTLGAVMALATSLNATMMVPARLAMMVAHDGLAPRSLGWVHTTRGTPVVGLGATVVASALLLWTGQLSLALNIAVLALIVLYLLHGVAFLALPRRDPELLASARVRLGPRAHDAIGALSVLALAALIAVMVGADLDTLAGSTFAQRFDSGSLTSLELGAAWTAVGLVLYSVCARRRSRGERSR